MTERPSPANMPGAPHPAIDAAPADPPTTLAGADRTNRPPSLNHASILDRTQHMRRTALELSVRHYADLECKASEVLETAKTWANWIRTGA